MILKEICSPLVSKTAISFHFKFGQKTDSEQRMFIGISSSTTKQLLNVCQTSPGEKKMKTISLTTEYY